MKTSKIWKQLAKTAGAAILSAGMIVSTWSVPAAAFAPGAEVVKMLVGEPTAVSTESIRNIYTENEEYIADFSVLAECGVEDGLAGLLASYSNMSMEIAVTVNDFTCTSEAAPLLVEYAQASDWTNWKQAHVALDETGKTYYLGLSLDGYEALGNLGFRFVGCDDGTYVDYEIEYISIYGTEKQESDADPDAIATLASPGTIRADEVVENPYGDDYIANYQFILPHALGLDLSGYSELKYQVGVTIHDYAADEFVPKTDDPGDVPIALIYAQDSAYRVWKQEAAALGETPQTIELEIDLRQLMDENDFDILGALGFRISGCDLGSTVTYTVDYAKVVGKGAAGDEQGLIDLKYNVTGAVKNLPMEETPVGQHGALSVVPVDGYSTPVIVDSNGKPFQLRGASSHGLSWFPQFVNEDALHQFRDEWGMNLFRISVYAREGNYAYVNGETAAAYNDAIIQKGVQAATDLGMYAIIDWHVLNYNPNDDLEQAKAFFTKYAQMYKDYDNVLFEVCNEPTNTPWYDGSGNDIYSYCKEMAQVIRDCGSNAIIICGTDSYSSKVDEVAGKPLAEDGFENIMYTCHFYSASHYESAQQKLLDAIAAGTPVFVSEFGICTASGDGVYDMENADAWLDICDANNISYACWAISNSEESAAYIFSTCSKTSGWLPEDITNTGRYLINRYNDRLAELAEAIEPDETEESTEPSETEEPTVPGDDVEPTEPGLNDGEGAETGEGGMYPIMLFAAAGLFGAAVLAGKRRREQ